MMLTKESFIKLQKLYESVGSRRIVDLFEQDESRQKNFSLAIEGLSYDFSKNNIDYAELDLLLELARECGLLEKIKAMFNGEKINTTESRSVLHTALRGKQVDTEILNEQNRVRQFCLDIDSGKFRGYSGKKIDTIINIGIGGSDLGVVLTSQALYKYRNSEIKLDFISSVDPDMADSVLAECDHETTIFVIVSKTFTTQETMLNARYCKAWFIDQLERAGHSFEDSTLEQHFVAVSSNFQLCLDFGIHSKNIFLFWEFVGGRYSIWSSVGLSIAIYIGYDNYQQMLLGAAAMDEHFRYTELSRNIPAIMAMVGIWHINFCQYSSLLISPYNYLLRSLPRYLQQLEMESNGKSVNLDGNSLSYQTCPIIWGGSANDAQHAYYQLLHQGMQVVPVDVIITRSVYLAQLDPLYSKQCEVLFANATAQTQAFMLGDDNSDSHKRIVGNKPTSLLLLDEISPYSLGMLLALYEHKVFVQGVIWNINSFDQMGVELGKKLTNKILENKI